MSEEINNTVRLYTQRAVKHVDVQYGTEDKLPVGLHTMLVADTIKSFATEELYSIYLNELLLYKNIDQVTLDNFLKRDKKTIRKILTEDLSDDQYEAFLKLCKWLRKNRDEDVSASLESPKNNGDRFFILRGYSGSGKTFLLHRLVLWLKIIETDYDYLFTAPTNKATKILRGIDPRAKTTYSALKLSMSEHEDTNILVAGDSPDLKERSLLCIDEASMLGKDITARMIETSNELGLKVLLVGDPAQLRPVKEYSSPAWKLTKKPENRAMLREVKRFDNQLLDSSIRIRKELRSVVKGNPSRSLRELLYSDNDKNGGIYHLSQRALENKIRDLCVLGVSAFQNTKVIAWRNKVVNTYNDIIREALGFNEEFCDGELILLAEPLTTIVYGQRRIIATVDDEFMITSVGRTLCNPQSLLENNINGLNSFEYWTLVTRDHISLNVVPRDDTIYKENLSIIAAHARKVKIPNGSPKDPNIVLAKKQRASLWRDFWKLRYQFTAVRYSYAQTCHRCQGSSIPDVILDAKDIMSNTDLEEKLQALYVGSTRAQKRLYVN